MNPFPLHSMISSARSDTSGVGVQVAFVLRLVGLNISMLAINLGVLESCSILHSCSTHVDIHRHRL